MRLLDFPAVASWLGTDEPSLLALLERGDFPQPVVIGSRLCRWSDVSLEEWAADGCPQCEPPSEPEFVRLRVLQVEESVAKLNLRK
jgi:predicted DNA-binding transcriptional regulator AlpA